MTVDDLHDPRLDRKVQFDVKSRSYPALFGAETQYSFRSYTWSCDVYNDQGREGACVGFAWSHELSARPRVIPTNDAWALNIYYRARQLDPWPGEAYDGTSVLAGIKAVQEYYNEQGQSLIREYRWAFGTEDALRVVGYKGPVVLGINWHENMYAPDENGFIHAAGRIVGGHAILMNGVKIVKKPGIIYAHTLHDIDLDKSYVRLHNSWGRGYGIGGDAFLSVRDLNALLQADGECCVPVLRSAG